MNISDNLLTYYALIEYVPSNFAYLDSYEKNSDEASLDEIDQGIV